MRSYKSYTDLRTLAKSYLSFSEKQNPDRSKSFSELSRPGCSENCVNLRDCGLVSPNLREQTIYRSSQVVSSREIQNLRLKAVLDLRVLKKSCKRHAEEHLVRVRRSDSRIPAFRSPRSAPASTSSGSDEDIHSSNGSSSRLPLHQWKSASSVCPICTKAFGTLHGVDVPIYHSDLVPWTTKLRVFGNLPLRTKALAIGEVCHMRNPEKLVAAAVVDPDVMGPQVLYKLLLDHSKSSMAKALRIFAKAENYPVLVHCIHGKDRTGLIIMLLLLLCDVPIKLVVADYIQSELQLKAGRDKGDLRELDDFLTSDNVIASKAETMVETITHLEDTYGCAYSYALAIGLTEDEIEQIRACFMKEEVQVSDTTLRNHSHHISQEVRQSKSGTGGLLSEKQASSGAGGMSEDDIGPDVISDVALVAADEAVAEAKEERRASRSTPNAENKAGDAPVRRCIFDSSYRQHPVILAAPALAEVTDTY